MPTTSRPVLVLQHAPWERPGLITTALAREGLTVTTRTVLDDADPSLPDPADLSALVVMGGPMGALDDAAHPGLAAERRLLAASVDADLPVLGVCLGMQLLAVALGGELTSGHGTEIGFAPVEVIGADPVLEPLGSAPTVLHWHADAVTLPPGAELVARTALTPVQAFRAGSALGLQFHLEVDGRLLAEWLAVPEMAADLADPAALTETSDLHLPQLEAGALDGLGWFAREAAARA